jgi:hypothetical protein
MGVKNLFLKQIYLGLGMFLFWLVRSGEILKKMLSKNFIFSKIISLQRSVKISKKIFVDKFLVEPTWGDGGVKNCDPILVLQISSSWVKIRLKAKISFLSCLEVP